MEDNTKNFSSTKADRRDVFGQWLFGETVDS